MKTDFDRQDTVNCKWPKYHRCKSDTEQGHGAPGLPAALHLLWAGLPTAAIPHLQGEN